MGQGAALAARSLSDARRRPFAEVLRTSVLEPIGMSRSTFEQPLSAARDRNAARAHDRTGKGRGPKWHVYPELAAELERARVLAEGRPVESRLPASHRLHLDAPERVLAVLVGNLLRNAFSYTDRGEVEITIDAQGVVIRDTGVGIAPERLAEIYRPFARGESARRGGFGVGLSIVRRLSDRFGWPVHIESQPGVGTRIEVRFPGARAEPVAQDGQ